MITEESFVDFKCPHCGEMVSFPKEDQGFTQACPNCTQSFIVPTDGSDMGWQIPLPITTARLVVRRFAPHDWKDLLEMVSEEETIPRVHSVPQDEDAILHWLEAEAHVKLTTPDQRFHIGIETQEGSKLIGYMSLLITGPQRRQAALDIFLSPKLRRQGLGCEALVALLTFCFEGLKLHRVSTWCDSRNSAARRLLEKAGLRLEGEFRKDSWIEGEWVDSVWYGLLEEEFSKSGSKAARAG